MGLEIRLAREGDLLSLVDLADGLMPGEAGREQRISVLKRALGNPNYELLVAELDGEVVGFADQWIVDDFCHGGRLSYIQSLYVAPNCRGMGLGSKLLKKLVESAEEKGVLEIHVTTTFDNQPAIKLYKKHGLTKESLQLEKEFR